VLSRKKRSTADSGWSVRITIFSIALTSFLFGG
jgi:hypothetical protein